MERVIPWKDFGYTKNSRICEKHFINDDIQWETSAFDERSRKNHQSDIGKTSIEAWSKTFSFP